MSPEQMLQICQNAVVSGMRVVRASQLSGPLAEQSEEKEIDKTRVTEVDKASAQAMLIMVPKEFSTSIEDGNDRQMDSQYVFIGDPIDGTAAFLSGSPISTVVGAFYDTETSQVVCSVSGEPISGRIWKAMTGSDTTYSVYDYARESFSHNRDCRVWKGPLSNNSRIFLDVDHGFPNKIDGEVDGMILTDQQMEKLIIGLLRAGHLQIAGTNIGNQSLIANGGEGAAGSVTSAKGGPQDLCAALQVQQAGGVIRGFNAYHGQLSERDPLDPMACNMLITANNPETGRQLVNIIRAAMS